jgi:hypothetical protein
VQADVLQAHVDARRRRIGTEHNRLPVVTPLSQLTKVTVSEYQYYEFLAIDRPLDEQQQAEVRALSTRADITATSFTSEYHGGDFRGDPRKMMELYYDAHLYFANWGTRTLRTRCRPSSASAANSPLATCAPSTWPG